VAYDERLTDRVRDILAGDPALRERKMFGGLAFMLDGNMCCGIVRARLMLRLGADLAEKALERTHVHPMDFTGRTMTGMVYVAPEGPRGKALRRWVEQAAGFARTLPPKRPSCGGA
jgi:TfoX/Sxy family transcriptional regulator of competence genes